MIEKLIVLGPAHATPEKFENATISGQFGFVFEKKLGQANHMILMTSSFWKMKDVFPSTLKHQAGVFKFIQFEELFPFS